MILDEQVLSLFTLVALSALSASEERKKKEDEEEEEKEQERKRNGENPASYETMVFVEARQLKM